MTRLRLVTALVLLFVATVASTSDTAEVPFKRELQLVYIFEGEKPDFIFLIGQSGFRSVTTLMEHLETWPRGAELTWAPGCMRFGNEPFLSSDEEMTAFRAFLAARGIEFVLVPSG